jgi:hypothetical protein
MSKVSDFIRGQKDCADGLPHKPGQSEDYDRGYEAQLKTEEQQGGNENE